MEILSSSKYISLTEPSPIDLLNLIPALVGYANTDLKYTYVNEAFLKFHQLGKNAALNKRIQDFFPAALRSLAEQNIQKALSGEKACFEISMEKDGEERQLEVTYIPQYNDKGQVAGLISYITHFPDKTQELFRKHEELRKSEDRYHKMVDEVEDYAIILLDKKGDIQNWNKGAEKIKGFKASEIIGKNFRLFYSEEDRNKKTPDKLLAEAETKGKATHEGWRVRKDGSKFWGAVVITALHETDGRILGFSKVTRDLTEKKASEEQQSRYTLELTQKNEELQKNEERYHKMIAEVEDYAIILLDRNGHIQNWNKGAEAIKGYKASEIIGKHFSVFYAFEDRQDQLPKVLLNEATTKGKVVHEGWRVKKDGSKFWGSVVITALHSESGDIIGYSKVTRDLTERKAAEERLQRYTLELQLKNEELRRSEERYHKMIAEVQDYAIILLDVDGNVLNWNRGAENIKGYAEAEIRGKNFSIFYPQESIKQKIPEQLLNEAKQKGSAQHEGWRVKKDGKRFWGSVVITALHDGNNNIIGFSKVTRDLTERKIAEEKQKQFAEQLQEQNKELEHFAYVASHDLQEPLRKIRTFNSLIIEHVGDSLSAKAKDYFDRSISAADRMNQLIEDLLTYSRATRDTHKHEPIDLNQVVGRIIKSHKETDKNVSIKSEHLPEVNGMRFHFEQLFDNLVGNGIKYQEPGNLPDINITYKKIPGSEVPGKHLSNSLMFHQISVTDNGIGFEPEYGEKIFEMFQRLHGRSEYPGSGIGLAIVKKIVQNYGGFITAEGRPGKGATFHVFLPVGHN